MTASDLSAEMAMWLVAEGMELFAAGRNIVENLCFAKGVVTAVMSIVLILDKMLSFQDQKINLSM